MAESNQFFPQLPRMNVAIIMDGNGRWAKKNSLNVTSGHEKGVEVVRRIVEMSAKAKLESLSLYAFSTENWSRPKKEILGIKKLIVKAIKSELPELISQKVRLNFFGDYSSFGKRVISSIQNAEKKTEFQYPNLKLNIALGYGGRADIIQATKLISKEVKLDKLSHDDITYKNFFNYLSAPIDDLDLLIRTGGDHRISNFLLYHLAYAEIKFLDTLWPDFTEKEFAECLADFSRTERRFGKRNI
ncbi:MAG: di-trans,poly-cis-decaprenylcistransferase [Gammaproteobacteria bacterium]|nr:di-trans,poly-cis-decaprenylcistransferase [Gammaproteobacteria bacterium]|tara:strand:- start:383 stop:1114 length:732 start_codon:yes stop_codon:yes gene_type:complete